ncbi:hypothetical protein Nepgr_021876 [Nepenthes gracilis]|uniref:CASP-like protein n=1 Tax=Nepenthes gracilis TaxID=150966 RepID=A0AAD3SZF5_NEPGR|nr:hypothetical protein Nepgr_021876 [Nepenthes gracilis]
MASTTTTTTLISEKQETVVTPPPPPPPPPASAYFASDAFFRVLLLAASIVAVVVMVTSKETELVLVSRFPFPVPATAKWKYSPALIYFVAALSTAGLYAIISTFVSLSGVFFPAKSPKLFLVLALHDTIVLGIVASATGAAAGVAYIGYKGNSHVAWVKVCNVYDKYCRHVAGSLAVGLFASFVLIILIFLNVTALYHRAPKL